MDRVVRHDLVLAKWGRRALCVERRRVEGKGSQSESLGSLSMTMALTFLGGRR